jgi:hypothetical protein
LLWPEEEQEAYTWGLLKWSTSEDCSGRMAVGVGIPLMHQLMDPLCKELSPHTTPLQPWYLYLTQITNPLELSSGTKHMQVTQWQILCFSTLSIILSLSKNRPVYFSKHNVSETGFCLHLQVKPDKDKTRDNVQKHNICTSVPSSQTLRSYSYSDKSGMYGRWSKTIQHMEYSMSWIVWAT